MMPFIKMWFKKRGALFNVSMLSFVAYMITNVANYGTQVCLGRLLGPGEYGSYNALMAILVLFAVPISALSFIFTRQVASYHAQRRTDWIVYYYRKSLVRLLIFGMTLCLLSWVLYPVFRSFLHIGNVSALLWLGPAAMAALFYPFNLAFVQGIHDFRWVTFLSAVAGPVRFVLCAGIVWLGAGLSGAVFATFLMSVCCWYLSTVPLRGHRQMATIVTDKPEERGWLDVVPVFVSTISFFVFTQCDVIVVKHLFSAEVSGLFASAALLGKTVLYIPSAVIVGLVPMASGQTQNEAKQLLKKALLMTLGLSGSGALLLCLMPYWILHTFFGSAYLPAADILQYFGLAMLPMAFILVLKAYFIARNINAFSYFMSLGAAGMLCVILWFSNTPMDVLRWMGIWGSVMMLAGLILAFFTPKCWRFVKMCKGVSS